MRWPLLATVAFATLAASFSEISAQQLHIFQQGRSGYSGCQDAHLLINKVDWNTGDEDMFEATGNGGEVDAKHALLRFDLSVLPTATHIDSAWLLLYFTQRRTPQEATKQLGVYRVRKPWGEGAGNDLSGYDGRPALQGEVNWNYAQKGILPWTVAGCNGVPADRDEVPEDTLAIAPSVPTGTWHSWTVTAMVRYWVAHPDSNFGLILREPTVSPAHGILDFASSEYSLPMFRPTLTVQVRAVPKMTTGSVSESHTYNSITVTATYTGDTNGNGSASLAYKLSSESAWSAESAMTRQGFQYVGTAAGLTPEATYDVRVTFSDPDGVEGTNPLVISSITLPAVVTTTRWMRAVIASPQNVQVLASFSGDANGNSSAHLAHRASGVADWTDDGPMTRQDTVFTKRLLQLMPDTDYEVRVTFVDPDGVRGENPLLLSIHTPSSSEVVRLESADASHVRITMANYTVLYDKAATNGYLWIFPTGLGSGALATRVVHGALFDVTKPEYVQSLTAEDQSDAVVIRIQSARDWADFSVTVWVYKASPGLVRWRTDVTPKLSQRILDSPRDVIFYDRTSNREVSTTIVKYAEQAPMAAGLAYLFERDLLNSTVLYFEDFSSLNAFFSLMRSRPERVVLVSESSIGYTRPVNTSVNLPMNSTFTMADTYVYIVPGEPLTESERMLRFLQNLGEIYTHLAKPDTGATDWTSVAEQELEDLQDPRCWVDWADLGGRRFWRSYVNDARPGSREAITQLDLLVATREYEAAFGNRTSIDDILESHLPLYFHPGYRVIINHPSADVTEGDSWYGVQLALGLSRLAKMGSATARQLLLDSLPWFIGFAHHVNYEFPVLFRYADYHPLGGAEPDVAGGYAYLMLDCYELTGDPTYLDEAKASVEHMAGKGFNLTYEVHMSAAGAAACARLFRTTGDWRYIDLSYLPVANLMRLCWLWECNYGLAANYLTFFGLSPMPEAGVITNKEQYESWRFLKEYLETLDRASAELPRGVQTLVEGFLMYTPQVLRYALPPFLPKEAVSLEPTVYNSVNVDSFYIPLEDLRDGWEKSGKLGQQIYGAGSPLVFAAATATSVRERPTEAGRPGYFALHQNFPNPFNATTVFRFDIGGQEAVSTTLRVHDVLGREVAVLLGEKRWPGRYTVQWDGRDEKGQQLASGVYVITLEAGKFHEARKALLLR